MRQAWNKGLKGVYRLSEDHKKKIAESLKGRPCSEKTKRKISVANTGKKRTLEQCKKLSELRKGKKLTKQHKINIGLGNKGKVLSEITKKKIGDAHKGEKNYNWQGDKISTGRIHRWLSENFGKADHCENPNCEHKSETYHWANTNNHKYRRRREDFMMLCAKCHSKYDMTEERRKKSKIENSGWFRKGHKYFGHKKLTNNI